MAKKYNLTKYNLSGVDQMINFTHEVSGNIIALVGQSRVIPFTHHVSGRFEAKVELSILVPFEHKVEGRIESKVMMHLLDNFVHEVKGELLCEAHIGKVMNVSHEVEGEIACKVHLGKIMHLKEILVHGKSGGEAHLGKIMHWIGEQRHIIYGNFVSFISMGLIRFAQFTVNTVMPPRSEIRINSADHSVTQNGVDIFYRYRGDWVEFTRDTCNIAIDTQTGQVSGQIVYDERFL